MVTYEYEVNENGEGLFQERQNVTSNYLHNYVCFESGYIRYLVTSGPEAALFDFFESQFQHDSHFERIFNSKQLFFLCNFKIHTIIQFSSSVHNF